MRLPACVRLLKALVNPYVAVLQELPAHLWCQIMRCMSISPEWPHWLVHATALSPFVDNAGPLHVWQWCSRALRGRMLQGRSPSRRAWANLGSSRARSSSRPAWPACCPRWPPRAPSPRIQVVCRPLCHLQDLQRKEDAACDAKYRPHLLRAGQLGNAQYGNQMLPQHLLQQQREQHQRCGVPCTPLCPLLPGML